MEGIKTATAIIPPEVLVMMEAENQYIHKGTGIKLSARERQILRYWARMYGRPLERFIVDSALNNELEEDAIAPSYDLKVGALQQFASSVLMLRIVAKEVLAIANVNLRPGLFKRLRIRLSRLEENKRQLDKILC